MKPRLAYILYKVYWEGEISRKDLIDKFNITAIQASKNFAELKASYPEAVEYNSSLRRYVPGNRIEEHLPSKNFHNYLIQNDATHSHTVSVFPNKPIMPVNLYRVARKAIHSNYAIRFKYHSLKSSSKKIRTVYPNSLVNSGYRWHIRGWEEDSGLFKDFNLSRIDVNEIELIKITNSKSEVKHDQAWNNEVEVILIPNPSLSQDQRGIISMDFNMNNGELSVYCKEALLLYTLNSYLVTDFNEKPQKTQLLAIGNLGSISKLLP